MNAVLAIIADNGRAIIKLIEMQYKKNIFSFTLLNLMKPFDDGLVYPLAKRLPGVWYVHPSKPCHWRGERLHHGGDVCVLVFSKPKPFRARVFRSCENGFRC